MGSKSVLSAYSALGARAGSCLPELVNRPRAVWRSGSSLSKVEGWGCLGHNEEDHIFHWVPGPRGTLSPSGWSRGGKRGQSEVGAGLPGRLGKDKQPKNSRDGI